MRASAWALLRAASNPCHSPSCFPTAEILLPHKRKFYVSSRSRREDVPTHPASNQLIEETPVESTREELPPDVEATSDEGPDKPSRPKDKSFYGSAARRAGRNVKRVKELPPVDIPPWFLHRNVHLHQTHQYPDGDTTTSRDAPIADLHDESPALSEDESATARRMASDGRLSASESSTDDSQKPSSTPNNEPRRKPSNFEPWIWSEIMTLTRAGLRIPSLQRAEFAVSQKPHFVLACPQDGVSRYLLGIGQLLAIQFEADYLRLDPQDIAEIGGDYLDEPSKFRPNTISSLGYDAPLLSAARNSPPPEDLAEEDDDDGVDESDTEHGGLVPTPFHRPGAGMFGGAAIHVGTFGGNIQDIFKSLLPSNSSTQPSKPIVVKQTQPQPKDMTPELQMGLLVETLLNAPEIKRVASSPSGTAGNDSEKSDLSEGKTAVNNVTQEGESKNGALHDRGAHDLVIQISDYPQINATINGGKFLDKLHEVVEVRRNEGQKVLIIGTSSSKNLMHSVSRFGVKGMQNQPHNEPMRTIITPVIDPPGNTTLTQEHTMKVTATNIRHLRDMLRRTAPNFTQVEDLVLDWDLEISTSIDFLSGLGESVWSMDRIGRVATAALGLLKDDENMTNQHLEKALELIELSDKEKQ